MEKKNSGVLIGITVGIVVMLCIIIGLFATNTITFSNKKVDRKTSDTGNTTNSGLLSDNEALEIGKKLYDKAIEMQNVYVLLPYCGYSMSEISGFKETNFGITDRGNLAYYETEYSDLDALKNELSNYFKKSIVDTIVNYGDESDVITDVAKLRDNEMASYVIYNNKLYCRKHVRKGYTSFYLGIDDITIDNIDENKISYNIKSAYVKDGPNNRRCYTDSTQQCTEDDKEYKDTKFVIEKHNDNWVVSEYTAFGYDANDTNYTILK